MVAVNDQAETWLIQFHIGRRIAGIHPEAFSREEARRFIKAQARRGIECSMRRVVLRMPELTRGKVTTELR